MYRIFSLNAVAPVYRVAILLLFASGPFQATALATEVSASGLSFNLPSQWKLVKQISPEAFSVRSSDPVVEVNVLVRRAPKITKENAEIAANELLESALATHKGAAKERNLDLGNVEFKQAQESVTWIGMFYGRDSSGRHFRYVQLVGPPPPLANRLPPPPPPLKARGWKFWRGA